MPERLTLQRIVDASTAGPATKLASRLLALTAVRVGVLRTATWGEIEGVDWSDPDSASPAAVWRISAERMNLEVECKGDGAFDLGYDLIGECGILSTNPDSSVDAWVAGMAVVSQRAKSKGGVTFGDYDFTSPFETGAYGIIGKRGETAFASWPNPA